MDEREALDRLRAAVPDEMPPASFDHGSVVRASRAAQRRRRQVVTGALTAVLVVGGLGGAVAALRALPGGSSDSSSGSGAVAASGRANAMTDSAPTGAAPFGQGPNNGIPGCGSATEALVSAVVQVLPAVSGRGPYRLTRPCPPGTTGAAFRVGDGPTSARLEVLLGPAVVASAEPSGSARTTDGRVVTVIDTPAPDGSRGPYAARVDELAAKVAAALR